MKTPQRITVCFIGRSSSDKGKEMGSLFFLHLMGSFPLYAASVPSGVSPRPFQCDASLSNSTPSRGTTETKASWPGPLWELNSGCKVNVCMLRKHNMRLTPCSLLGQLYYVYAFFIELYAVLLLVKTSVWGCLATHLTLPLAPSSLPGHRFEDVPGMRRHLVRKSTKGQVHTGKDHKEPTTRSRKQDRTPHEVRHELMTRQVRCHFFPVFQPHRWPNLFLEVYLFLERVE